MPKPKALLIAAPGVFRDQLAAQLAAEEGSDIVTAGHGAAARAAMGESLFSFVLIDDALPDETAAALARGLEDDGFSVPMLLLTNAEESTDGLARLAKPFRFTALMQALGRLLAHPAGDAPF